MNNIIGIMLPGCNIEVLNVIIFDNEPLIVLKLKIRDHVNYFTLQKMYTAPIRKKPKTQSDVYWMSSITRY